MIKVNEAGQINKHFICKKYLERMQFSAKGHSVCAQLLTATKDKVPLFFGETTATQGQESSFNLCT